MANLTITIDGDLLKKARQRALENGTSVNAVLRDYLTAYAGDGESRRRALTEILDLAARVDTGSGGRRWTRDELHER